MAQTTMRTVAARLDPRLGRNGRKITVAYRRNYAQVELDRDNWVDAYRHPDELTPEFAAAVERCQDAGIWRIWLGGHPQGFGYGSGGRWVTLFVPLQYVDEAVAALKAAELRGDLSKLDCLTEKLAPPFDEWLAPGERYLSLGRDFICTPQRFLYLLRGKAKGLDLQLNGRVYGNGVWVRPTRSSTGRMLRKAFPERYEDGPDPYDVEPEEPSRRPPAPYRHRSSRVVSEVRFLPTRAPESDKKCACGWELSDRDHERKHTHWSTGVPIPDSLIFRESVAVVDTMAAMRWRRLAYDCARIAQRDGRYDNASFDWPKSEPEPSDINLRAYLMRAGGRVVGYLSAADREWHAFWDFDPDARPPYVEGPTRPWVNLIFVAREWRRRGVGGALIRAMAADAGVDLPEVSWSLPFSNEGQRLARAMSPSGVWVSR